MTKILFHHEMAREAIAMMYDDYIRVTREYRRKLYELEHENDELRRKLGMSPRDHEPIRDEEEAGDG